MSELCILKSSTRNLASITRPPPTDSKDPVKSERVDMLRSECHLIGR